MIWQPKYTITDKLAFTIRLIGESIGEIRHMGLARSTLALLEHQARELSSFASTSIEGNPLPLTDVKSLLKASPKHIRDTEREVLNYNHALEMVYESIHKGTLQLNAQTLEHIQSMVIDGLMDNPKDIGHLRQKPVVIRNPKEPDSIVFMPPDYKDVPRLIDSMFTFINMNIGAIDPVILAGLFHRQCVIIHPFMDGNGRSTRIMTTALLGVAGLDIFEIFSFENYYNRNVTKYFKKVGLEGDYYDLQDSTDFTAWLEYFADGILDELRRVAGVIPSSNVPRLEEHHKRLLAAIEEQGSITQREYAALSNRSLAARKKDFQKLLDLGLIEVKGGGRSIHYIIAKTF